MAENETMLKKREVSKEKAARIGVIKVAMPSEDDYRKVIKLL